jgi:hypothetical protein
MAIRKIVSRSLGDGTVNKQELDVSASGAGTGAAILPSGTTGQRPGSATEGMLRYNSTTGLYEQYTATGWQAVDAPPTVSSISPNTFNGESGTTITLTGTGFKTGCTVKFISNGGTEYTATTTTFVSSVSVTATTPQDFTVADEPFDVKIINASGLAGTLENALDCGGSPTFTTASGTLGTIYDSSRSSYSLSTAAATDPDTSATISYAVTSGALPTGMSLNTSTAAITGTPNAVGSDTTSSFTVTATDNAGNTASRAFSIVIKAPVVTSFTSTGSSTFSVPTGVSSIQVLVIAGGGGGAFSTSSWWGGGGGGAGGYIEMSSFPVTPGGSVSYTVGGGGAGGTAATNGTGQGAGQGSGANGSNSVFGSLTAIGGGGGSGDNAGPPAGVGIGWPGGSGGGGSGPTGSSPSRVGGTATQTSQPGNSGTYGYGNNGGDGGANTGGGGGGAGGAGTPGPAGGGPGFGAGGNGRASSITGSSVTRGGGGGGGWYNANVPGPGGPGGGGAGGTNNSGTNGTNNTGGGGGGGGSGSGGPGVIIIKY